MDYYNEISAPMRETLTRLGYAEPTPIQQKTLEPLMAGRDLIGIAETGSGKTAAFGIPMIERVFSDNKKTQALIISPTRELAIQTTAALKALSAHKKLRIVSIYGGQSASIQIKAVRAGAQIIAGTPGRIKDLIERGVIKLKNVRTVVLDEADEMLDFGFLPDIKNIMAQVGGAHQTLLFSATMSGDISKVAKQFLSDPVRVEIGERNEPAKTVRQLCIKAEDSSKLSAIDEMMETTDPRLTIVFCNTRSRVKKLTKTLTAKGMRASCIHGDLSQSQRDKIMDGFRSGRSNVLVATDVAARGIDVKNIDLVVNYDVPDKPEYYIHRIGRTGRAGRNGTACTLVNSRDRSNLNAIKNRYHVLMETAKAAR